MKRILLAAVILLWVSQAEPVTPPVVAHAALQVDPAVKAVLTGPKTVKAGQPILLQASESIGKTFTWKTFPPDQFIMVGDGRKQAISWTDEPGPCTFAVLVLDGEGGADVAIWTVIVGKPLPPPEDPDDPDDPPPLDPGKPTAAVYIYEKDQGGVPPAVSAALSKLNATGIRATTFEEDTTDGSGDTPDQYRVPLEAARKAGLPCLVVMAGQNVKRVVKAPTTDQQVLDAVQAPARDDEAHRLVPSQRLRDGEVRAPVADETAIPPLSSVLAALNCGCQSGKRCTCHAGGAHCDCASDMRKARKLYPKTIVRPKPKAKPKQRMASR